MDRIQENDNLQLEEMLGSSFSTDIPLDEVNNLNIVINDSDCSDTFFAGIIDRLQDDGLNFRTVINSSDINYDGHTVITLDQQYSSGADSIVFAPYNNTALGNSDALALATKAALLHNNISVSNILCGQVGYVPDENGNVSTMRKTDTEMHVDADHDTSFVGISFGTNENSPEKVAKAIEETLARYVHYIDNYDNSTDLIYRAGINDKIDDVSSYFGSDSYQLKDFNNMKDDYFSDSQTIVNPEVARIDAFKDTTNFKLSGTYNKTAQL